LKTDLSTFPSYPIFTASDWTLEKLRGVYEKWRRDFEAELRSRCAKCNINPDWCSPMHCESKLTPKEILGDG